MIGLYLINAKIIVLFHIFEVFGNSKFEKFHCMMKDYRVYCR